MQIISNVFFDHGISFLYIALRMMFCYLFRKIAGEEIPLSDWILQSSEATPWRLESHILERKSSFLELSLGLKDV